MAKRSQSSDLEAQGSSLAHCLVSLDKEFYSTLSLFTQAYKWVPTPYWGGGGGQPSDGLASHTGGSSNNPRHASC